jgi:hydrogenase maturation protease
MHQNPESDAEVLILGLGNTILTDEGLGVKAMERLIKKYEWPDNVTFLDGGVMGLDLLPYLEGAEALLILDAVEIGKPPGTLARLEGDEIPTVVALKMSMHQVGLQETLAMASFRSTIPKRMVLWGMVPASLALGTDLTATAAGRLDELVRAAVRELKDWGVDVRERTAVRA